MNSIHRLPYSFLGIKRITSGNPALVPICLNREASRAFLLPPFGEWWSSFFRFGYCMSAHLKNATCIESSRCFILSVIFVSVCLPLSFSFCR
ncbi:hypothetical protein Barb4_05567 [Bacteroidales bacterium Barb4]|nr:hypothetical protein Barb4_05567 [Bacteroidales bacterium Barb4]